MVQPRQRKLIKRDVQIFSPTEADKRKMKRLRKSIVTEQHVPHDSNHQTTHRYELRSSIRQITNVSPSQVRQSNIPFATGSFDSSTLHGQMTGPKVEVQAHSCISNKGRPLVAAKTLRSITNDSSPSQPDRHVWPKLTAKQPYRTLQKLGFGSEGVVYAAIRKCDGKQVAVKKIRKENTRRWGMVGDREVPVEIELLHKVSGHPGVIQMLDWFVDGTEYMLVLERLPNSVDLFDYHSSEGDLSEENSRKIFSQIAHALLHCHERGVVHRDVKEENIVIDKQTMQAKLIDFGCGARIQDAPYKRFVGTRQYFPPECFTDESWHGKPMDVWALGVLLFVMVENAEPFQDEQEIMKNGIRFNRGNQFSKSCRDFVHYLLRKDRSKRPTVTEALEHQWFRK